MSEDVTSAAVQDFISKEFIDCGVEEDKITPDAKFDDLDIDSIDVADMMTSVKRKYGVDIPRRELVGVTIGQLADMIVSNAPQESSAGQ